MMIGSPELRPAAPQAAGSPRAAAKGPAGFAALIGNGGNDAPGETPPAAASADTPEGIVIPGASPEEESTALTRLGTALGKLQGETRQALAQLPANAPAEQVAGVLTEAAAKLSALLQKFDAATGGNASELVAKLLTGDGAQAGAEGLDPVALFAALMAPEAGETPGEGGGEKAGDPLAALVRAVQAQAKQKQGDDSPVQEIFAGIAAALGLPAPRPEAPAALPEGFAPASETAVEAAAAGTPAAANGNSATAAPSAAAAAQPQPGQRPEAAARPDAAAAPRVAVERLDAGDAGTGGDTGGEAGPDGQAPGAQARAPLSGARPEVAGFAETLKASATGPQPGQPQLSQAAAQQLAQPAPQPAAPQAAPGQTPAGAALHAAPEGQAPTMAANAAQHIQRATLRDDTLKVELSPKGAGGVEIDLQPAEAGKMRVVIRAENPAFLQALRSDRHTLQALLDGSSLPASGSEVDYEGFGGRSRRDAPPEPATRGPAGAEPDAGPEPVAATPRRVSGRLDIIT